MKFGIAIEVAGSDRGWRKVAEAARAALTVEELAHQKTQGRLSEMAEAFEEAAEARAGWRERATTAEARSAELERTALTAAERCSTAEGLAQGYADRLRAAAEGLRILEEMRDRALHTSPVCACPLCEALVKLRAALVPQGGVAEHAQPAGAKEVSRGA
jgi:hypothetical protein